MSKVTIYLSIVVRNGKKHLHLRDSNRTCKDESLVTEVSRGDLVVWKRDTKSGIKSIKAIDLTKDKDPFVKGVFKGWCMAWKGIVSKDAKGEYPYHVSYVSCNPDEKNIILKSAKSADDDDPPPIIKVRD